MPATLAKPPKAKAPVEDGDYLVWRDVPVWKEHVSPDDSKTVFDSAALERVAERCNERIEDTGNFVPVVIRHTKDDDSNDPPVIGMAGPFTVGRFGRKKPRAAIFAKEFRIHKRYAKLADRYPRLSVEYWGKKSDPTNGFFDPISLLGAETPQLDLGHWNLEDGSTLTRYKSQSHRGMVRHRYEMTSPAGANSAVPEVLGDEAEKTEYERDSGGSMSPEDIAQFVAAFTPVIKAQFDELEGRVMQAIDQKLADAGLSETDDDLSDDPPGGMSPIDGDAAAEGTDATPDESADDGDEAPSEEPAGDDEEDEEEEDVPPIRYQRERDEYRTKYQKLQADHRDSLDRNQALETELATLRGSQAKQTRYSRIADLEREGFVLDRDSEAKDCEGFSDEQFERHVERVRRSYQRVPNGAMPMEKPKPMPQMAGQDGEFRARYARLAADRFTAAQGRGESPDWNRCLAEAKRELSGGLE